MVRLLLLIHLHLPSCFATLIVPCPYSPFSLPQTKRSPFPFPSLTYPSPFPLPYLFPLLSSLFLLAGDIYNLAHRLDKNGVLVSIATNFNSPSIQRLSSSATLTLHPLSSSTHLFTSKPLPAPVAPITEFQVEFMKNNFYAFQGIDMNVFQGNIFAVIGQKPSYKVALPQPLPQPNPGTFSCSSLSFLSSSLSV